MTSESLGGRGGWHSLLRSLLMGACGLSVAGSLWAAVGSSGCASCETAAAAVGHLPLGLLGVLFYGQLLAALIWRGHTRYTSACTLVAVAIHASLMVLLLTRRIVCPSCLLTAAGACAMLAIHGALEPQTWRRAAIILPIAGAVILMGRFVFLAPYTRILEQRHRVMFRQQFQLALEREAREAPVPAGRVRILVYARPTCPACRELEAKVMPVIRREIGSALEVVYRRPWKGIITPTLIIRGQTRTQYVGLPTVAALREAIAAARDGSAQSRVTSRESQPVRPDS